MVDGPGRDRDASVPDNRSDCLLARFLEYDCYYYLLAHAPSLPSIADRIDPPSMIFVAPRTRSLRFTPLFFFFFGLFFFFFLPLFLAALRFLGGISLFSLMAFSLLDVERLNSKGLA